MLCHKCPHNGKPNVTACLKCGDTADALYHDGKVFVSFDAMTREAKPKTLKTEPSANLNLPPCCEDAVRRLFGTLMQLSKRDRNMLFFILRGGSLGEYGRRVGMTKQAIHYRVARLATRHREFAWMSKSIMQGCNAKKEARHGG